jgi:hypothetical protein
MGRDAGEYFEERFDEVLSALLGGFCASYITIPCPETYPTNIMLPDADTLSPLELPKVGNQ